MTGGGFRRHDTLNDFANTSKLIKIFKSIHMYTVCNIIRPFLPLRKENVLKSCVSPIFLFETFFFVQSVLLV